MDITKQLNTRANRGRNYLELANFWATLSLAMNFKPEENNFLLDKNTDYGRHFNLAFKKFHEAVNIFDTGMGLLQNASKTPEVITAHFDIVFELTEKVHKIIMEGLNDDASKQA